MLTSSFFTFLACVKTQKITREKPYFSTFLSCLHRSKNISFFHKMTSWTHRMLRSMSGQFFIFLTFQNVLKNVFQIPDGYVYTREPHGSPVIFKNNNAYFTIFQRKQRKQMHKIWAQIFFLKIKDMSTNCITNMSCKIFRTFVVRCWWSGG